VWSARVHAMLVSGWRGLQKPRRKRRSRSLTLSSGFLLFRCSIVS
jgi:hypothetical protein